MDRFYLKTGDTGRPLIVVLEDASGTAQNLFGATVAFNMRKRGSSTRKVDSGACTVVDEDTGKVRYDFESEDVDTAGVYEGEFVVTLADDTQVTFPSGPKPTDYNLIIVQDDV